MTLHSNDGHNSRLPAWLKAVYALGYFGQTVLQNAFYFFVMVFYTDVVRLSPPFIGIALAVGRIFDAATNPLMGQISDRTRTPLGRRRPYVMAGGVVWGMVFMLLWLALPGWSQGMKFAFLVGMDILFAIGVSVFLIPYFALGAELSLDYDERNSIAGYRIALMQIGQIVGAGMLALAYAIKARMNSWPELARLASTLPNAEWSLAAIILGGVSMIGMFLSGLIPKERFATRAAVEFTSWQAFRTTITNSNFRRVVATYVTFYGFTFLGNFMLPYLLIYYVKKPGYIMPLYGVAALSGMLTLPLWLQLGRVLEKSVVLRIVCVWQGTIYPASLILFNPSHPWLMVPFSIIAGSGQAAFETYSHSLLADVTDEDELRTGQRREGMYFGVYNLLLKVAISVGLVWSGFGLAFVGYVPNAEQTVRTLWGMRLMFALPFLPVLLGLLYLRRYSLDRTRLDVIHVELERRSLAREVASCG